MRENAGVYCIFNKVTGQFYIGRSLDVNQRRYQHKYSLREHIHENPKLQKSWDKYGEPAFEFRVLMYTTPSLLDKVEKRFLESFRSNEKCLNIMFS